MSIDLPAHCPKCGHKFFFKTKAKRPNPVCPKCKNKFLIPSTSSTNTNSTQKPDSFEKEGGADPPSNRGSFIKIDDDTIESMILEKVNSGKYDTALVRCAIEFYYKIRGKDDKITENIPMEDFMDLGKSLKNSD